MEPKAGHVLFTSLLMIEGAQLLGAAIKGAAAAGVPSHGPYLVIQTPLSLFH